MPPQLTCPACGTPNRMGAKFCNNCAASLSSSITGRLPPNTVLQNRYIVIKPLGRGGMGAVYQAADQRFSGKFWAIKEMSDAGLNPVERQRAIQDFQREANMLAGLNHSNLPRVVDNFEENGKWYLVMDFIEGETLEEKLEQSATPLRQDEVIDWAIQLCDVLTYLHTQNPPLIFRDLKPANIMRETKTGCIKLIDFGIARFFKSGQARDTSLLGTAGYAPPEQHGKGQTDARSDIYALGVTMHQLLTKYDPTTTPFNLPTPRSLSKSIPAPLETVITTATELDPSKRFQNVAAMRYALASLARTAVAPTQSASATSGHTRTQPVIPPVRSTPPFAVTLIVAFLVITGVPGLIAFGAGFFGILSAVSMWFKNEQGRRVAISYLVMGLAAVGIGEIAAMYQTHSYGCNWNYARNTCDWENVFYPHTFVVGLLAALVFTLGVLALMLLFRENVLDFFYPQNAPHQTPARASVTFIAWLQILLGFWLVFPLILGFGLLYRKRWALVGTRIFTSVGTIAGVLIFLFALPMLTSDRDAFIFVLSGHFAFLLFGIGRHLITRPAVNALF